jgi:hypothetical protein
MIRRVVAVSFRENFENEKVNNPSVPASFTPLADSEARLPAKPPTTGNEPKVILSPPQKELLKPVSTEIEYGGIFYQSASEVACGVLMQRYIKGFTVRRGETYEVPIGVNQAGGTILIDFFVQGVLLEYHPPKFQKYGGDFTLQDYKKYRLMLKSAGSNEDKERIKADARKMLAASYQRKRLQQIEASPNHKGIELVVASSPEELYSKIILRFAQHPPVEEFFLTKFRNLRAQVWKQASRKGR